MSNKSLLIVNVHFAPNSFGGATVVAENMANELANVHGWNITVITSHQDQYAVPYSMVRYTTGLINVFSVVIPEEGALSYEERYDNPRFTTAIEGVVSRLGISVAHIHAIQSVGVGIISLLKARGIPVVTTVHDCWWLCERMFMIDSRGRYCHQQKIDLRICRHCVIDVDKAKSRSERLKKALNTCDLLLFPSEFQKSLYLANDTPEHKCLVNKNGILPPQPDYARRRHESRMDNVIRFGFVGGPGDIKGAPLIRRALSEIKHSNYQLLVVDGARNRGLTWASSFNWSLSGEIKLIPPYNRETMDTFFASIDVLLFPSQWKESFGLTVREAISRGIWVIATDSGGVPEDCRDGENADLIHMDGSHLELKAAIERILSAGRPPTVTRTKVVTVSDQASELDGMLAAVLPAATPANAPRRVMQPSLLFICGMHRSGTSSIAGELFAHGAAMPEDLLEPDEGNPKGYFESKTVVRINEETLELFGSHWRDPSPLPERWLDTAKARGKRDLAVDVLRQAAVDGKTLVIKDPRLSRLLPLWLDAAREANMPASVTIVMRNPLAVAGSLWRRNHIPLNHSLQLWARYHIDLLLNLQSIDYDVIEFERFSKNPAQSLSSLNATLASVDFSNGSTQFFDPMLVGEAIETGEGGLPQLMQADYFQKQRGKLLDGERVRAYYEAAGGDKIANERRHYGAVSMILDTVVSELNNERAAQTSKPL